MKKRIKDFLENNIEDYINSHGSIGEDYAIDFEGLSSALVRVVDGFVCKTCNKLADLGCEIDLVPHCRKCYRLHYKKKLEVIK